MVNHAASTDVLEFVIKHKPGGAVSTWIGGRANDDGSPPTNDIGSTAARIWC